MGEGVWNTDAQKRDLRINVFYLEAAMWKGLKRCFNVWVLSLLHCPSTQISERNIDVTCSLLPVCLPASQAAWKLLNFDINSTLDAHSTENSTVRKRREGDRCCWQNGRTRKDGSQREKELGGGEIDACSREWSNKQMPHETQVWVRLASLTIPLQHWHIILLKPGTMSALHYIDRIGDKLQTF